jgi:23S rRNA (guanosine2251-2'-O)-methyltransferase
LINKDLLLKNENLIYGIHAVKALLRYDSAAVDHVWVDRARKDPEFQDWVMHIEKKSIHVERVSRKDLDNLLGEVAHQGVVARSIQGAEPKGDAALNDWLENTPNQSVFLLILDGVQDPHNLGAVIRTAAAAGCDAIIAPKDRAVGLTPVVHKVSCGASQLIPFFQVTNLVRAMEGIKKRGIWLVGAAGEASQTVYQTDLTGAIGIVMGAEGEGLRKLTRDTCDFLAKIPMTDAVESLNVSVATGVFIFESVRQRMQSKSKK